jgi:branched-chain amino acid aminotransferase
MSVINLNGKIYQSDEPVLLASNRSFRYGDGLFETMKVVKGFIPLSDYHFERLFSSFSLLQFEVPKLLTADKLQSEIINLCKKNDCLNSARVRLSFFRGNGGLYDGDKSTQYVIEAWPLSVSLCEWNANGLVTDIYMDAKKMCDAFSHLKSSSCLPYNLAAQYAKANQLNDCFLLNSNGNIADTTIANVFMIKEDEIITPPLTEGCVAGVMRRHVVHTLLQQGYKVIEKPITIEALTAANEIFLTNAVRGLQWVGQFRHCRYDHQKTIEIYNQSFKQ